MITIVDPEEIQHVLRPTIYAAAIKDLASAASRRTTAPQRRPASEEPVSPSQHD